MLLSTGVLISP